MLHLRNAAVATLSIALLVPAPTEAAEQVGEAVLIKTEVRGAAGSLSVDDPIHRDERINTSLSGLGQFTFRDGTKLAVGWGSSVVIDKFVFDDSGSVKKLTVKAAKGTFRWISGNSNSSAYQIVTPAGTIGVRGTAFDFYVGGNGTTAVVLLNGAAQFCGAGGCRQLTKKCDVVVASRNGAISDARRVNRDVLDTLGNARALPFLSGDQQLFGRMAFAGAGGCGLSAAARGQSNGKSPRAAPTEQSPAPRATPSPISTQGDPPAMNMPSRTESPPAAAAPTVSSTPDPPTTSEPPSSPPGSDPPDPPSKPDKHHDHHHHGKGEHGWGHHDGGRRGWGNHGGGRYGWGDHSPGNSDPDGQQNGEGRGDRGSHHR